VGAYHFAYPQKLTFTILFADTLTTSQSARHTPLAGEQLWEDQSRSGTCASRGPFTFRARRAPTDFTARPLSVLLYGDMGRDGGGQVLRALKQEFAGVGPTCGTGPTGALSGSVDEAPDAVVHVGDFAYDLQDLDGLTGDNFLARIESLAARVPYMYVCRQAGSAACLRPCVPHPWCTPSSALRGSSRVCPAAVIVPIITRPGTTRTREGTRWN